MKNLNQYHDLKQLQMFSFKKSFHSQLSSFIISNKKDLKGFSFLINEAIVLIIVSVSALNGVYTQMLFITQLWELIHLDMEELK